MKHFGPQHFRQRHFLEGHFRQRPGVLGGNIGGTLAGIDGGPPQHDRIGYHPTPERQRFHGPLPRTLDTPIQRRRFTLSHDQEITPKTLHTDVIPNPRREVQKTERPHDTTPVISINRREIGLGRIDDEVIMNVVDVLPRAKERQKETPLVEDAWGFLTQADSLTARLERPEHNPRPLLLGLAGAFAWAFVASDDGHLDLNQDSDEDTEEEWLEDPEDLDSDTEEVDDEVTNDE